MATRSAIIVQTKPGVDSFMGVYCHYDGYLEHNGKILFKHYNSRKKALKLVRRGNMSVLGKFHTKGNNHTFETPSKNYTIYYGRDRNETGQKPTVGPLELVMSSFGGCIKYVFIDGEWTIGNHSQLKKTLRQYNYI